MATIPQRELRNDAGAVLRRAEAGEVFTITVDGRPVAQLGPLPAAVGPTSSAALFAALAASPIDPEWLDEHLEQRVAERANAVEPWD